MEGLSNKQQVTLLKGLQDGNNQFEENQYLQHAVESTINCFFKKILISLYMNLKQVFEIKYGLWSKNG